jgi:ADP-ribosylation factor related protein 1
VLFLYNSLAQWIDSSRLAGTITLPSTILRFVDLGGQTGIRTLWHRYYDDADAIIYVLDASNRDRLPDSWEVLETVLSAPQIAGSPLLLLANKQDVEHALTVEDVRYEYEAWWHNRVNDPRSLHSQRAGESGPIMRSASLDVMGISALQGSVAFTIRSDDKLIILQDRYSRSYRLAVPSGAKYQ